MSELKTKQSLISYPTKFTKNMTTSSSSSLPTTLNFLSTNQTKTHSLSKPCNLFFNLTRPFLPSFKSNGPDRFICKIAPIISPTNTHYEFLDSTTEVELRLELEGHETLTSADVFVDLNDTTLAIKVRHSGTLKTLMETTCLYDKIKPGETIWYMDENQLVVSLKKQDPELKWPDIVETWESLSVGVLQLLKGTSIYLVGESSEINEKICRELAVGLGYTPLTTKELLETYTKQSIDSWVSEEGPDSVAEAESAILESLSSHVRAVVATLGGKHGAATRDDQWRHLYAGFTVWLSQSNATNELSAKEEARKSVQDGSQAYANADVVVKLGGWDPNYSKAIAQASLSAIKQLILSDKKLPGKKGMYIRLGCRGDWPNIKPPGWDPSNGDDNSPSM